MPEHDNGLSRDALEIANNLIDLTKQLALTNQNLSFVGSEVSLHSKLLYGDEKGEGGMVLRVNVSDEALKRHESILAHLEASCGDVVKSLAVQLEIAKSQSASLKNLNRVVFGLAGIVMFILISLGIAGWKEIAALLSSIP